MRLLLTGGSGRLGRELTWLLPEVVAPSRRELDVTDPASVAAAVARVRPDAIVHAAAFTDVVRAEVDREACWRVNVAGTRHVLAAAAGLTVVLISTDYVFWGDRGGYREEDPVGPVRNHYALSKLVAEELVRSHASHVIVRTSFRARTWLHPVAFTDLFTSQDYVDVIAPEIALLLTHLHRVHDRVLHVATERKSAFELARRRAPHVAAGSKATAAVALPDDVSLDTARWAALRRSLLT
jgi:dTDP-4-dehydrorhamnose reductase